MNRQGMVYLVGAGPGDPGLITVKGRECLARAEVVVHDHLAGEGLLTLAPPAAELIYVGKCAGQHTMGQDEINTVLVAKAREGKTVVRLKGGDPYVFGRGGEEAEVLREAGIGFEVVPGVTAGIAAAAYAGIPVTHRGHNSVLTLVTGHEDPTKDDTAINWNGLAAVGGTIVFYMGVKNLARIAERLIAAGQSPQTPVALVRWGTMPVQTVVTGTLATIAERVREAGLTPPCVIVVGSVVRLREKLDWFERRPLFGKTIVITRSKDQSSELAARLRELGADVLAFHTIRFEPPANLEPLRQSVRNVREYQWIIFTSVNGVDRFFEMLYAEKLDTRSLAGCRVCAIGPGTAGRLESHGVRADLLPEKFTSAAIFEAMSRIQDLRGRRILMTRADIAGKELPARLTAAGAEVTDIEAYRTLPGELSEAVRGALDESRADIVTFSSSSTARNFASIVRAAIGRVPENVAYVSIGPETTRAASEEGLKVAAEAKVHTIEGLVAAILEHCGGKAS